MKKIIIASTALALALSTVPAFVGQAQAAPAKSPYCNLAPATTSASWAEYYGCWGGHPMAQYKPYKPAPTHVVYTGPGQTDFCKLPVAANASWAEYYGCWRPHR
jgi:hypothetical protein